MQEKYITMLILKIFYIKILKIFKIKKIFNWKFFKANRDKLLLVNIYKLDIIIYIIKNNQK